MKRRHKYYTFFLSLALLLVSPAAHASAFAVQASGADEMETLGNLCRKALSAYVAGEVGEETYEHNREKISRGLLDSCKDFVPDIEILERSTAEGGGVSIKGRAVIDDVRVLGVLKALGLPSEEKRTVAVFASEKILGEWVVSYVNLMLDDDIGFNECEAAIGEELKKRGFDEIDSGLSAEGRRQARALKGVFGRYRDVSTMPNDILARATSILDTDARFAIACRAIVDSGTSKDSAFMYTCCANTSCKVVDTIHRRRVVTDSESKCLPHANRTTGNIAAIKASCKAIGERLAKKLADKYLKEGAR